MPRRAKYNPSEITSIYEQNVPRSFQEATRKKLTRRSLSLITNINNAMRDRIREVLREGVAEGKSVSAVASGLLTTGLDKGVFASARKRAWMVAKTELHRARQRGAIDIYKHNKIKQVQWVVISDDRICERCEGRSGQVYRIRDLNEENMPPIHPRCRCLIDKQIPILTLDGWKPIGKIKIGDLVLTHKGRFRKVTETIVIPKQEVQLVTLECNLSPAAGCKNKEGQTFNAIEKLTVTDDHPILVKGKWVKAGDIQEGDKIEFLASRCKRCDKIIPFYKTFCSTSCQSKWITKNQWSKPEHRENVSLKNKKAILLQYANGTRDRYKITENSHIATKEMVRNGTHPFFDPENRKKARRVLGKSLSKIEKRIQWVLSKNNIPFESQFPIFKGLDVRGKDTFYYIDCVIPDLNIAIECDGEYWHQDKKKDDIRQTYIEKLGWQFLRFSGEEINKSLAACEEKILRLVKNHSHEYEFLPIRVKKVIHWVPKSHNRPKTIDKRIIEKIHKLWVKSDKSYGDMSIISRKVGVSRPTVKKYIYGEIKENSFFRPRRKTLYNLEVEEDQSYIAKGYAIHNCRLLPTDFQVSIKVKQTDSGKVMETKVYPSPQSYKYVIKIKKSLEDLEKFMPHKYIRREGGSGAYKYFYDIPKGKDESKSIKTVGLGISAQFAKEKFIDLRGQKVSSAQDVAEIAQIYRNPKYETFRYIYVKNGVVVGHEGRSCHIPGFTLMLKPECRGKDLFEIKRRIARLGADEVWVLHNHPSGNPTPSTDDLTVSEWLSKKIPEIKGSIVINSGKYSFINAELGKFGQFDYETYDIKTDEKIHQKLIENPLLGHIIRNKDDVSEVASALKSPVGFTIVLYRTPAGEVRAIQEVPTKMLNHYEASLNYFRGRMREFGSQDVLVADSGNSKLEGQGYQNILRMVSDGDILDDVKFDDLTGRALESVREGIQPEHQKNRWMGLPIKTYVTKSL